MLLQSEGAREAAYKYYRMRGLAGYADNLPPFNASDPTARNLAIAHAILTDPQALADYAAQGGVTYANAIIANGGYLPGTNFTYPTPPALAPPPTPPAPPVTNSTAVTVMTIIPMGLAGTQIIYSDGSTALWPYGVTPPTPGSPKSAMPAGGGSGTPPPTVRVGATFHYQGYAITIKTVGAGASTGLLTDEGVQLPVGTVYIDTVDGSIWRSDTAHGSTQITDGSGGGTGGGGSQGTEHLQVDASGNLAWAFAPTDAAPFQLYYDNGDGNWQPLANGQTGSVSLASLAPGAHTIVMHATQNGALVEVDRITYTVPAGGGPGTVTTASWFTNASQEIIGGVPNWMLAGGAAFVAYLVFKKK